MTESNDLRANPLLETGNVGFCAEKIKIGNEKA